MRGTIFLLSLLEFTEEIELRKEFPLSLRYISNFSIHNFPLDGRGCVLGMGG